jgi:hypothetical protein
MSTIFEWIMNWKDIGLVDWQMRIIIVTIALLAIICSLPTSQARVYKVILTA